MNTIRRLHSLDPVQFSTPALAEQFKISAEAVRRILKSRFRTNDEVEEEKIGDELLKEAELGSYDRGGQERRPSLAVQQNRQQTVFPERTRPPAPPLQEGYDPDKFSSKYKWASRKRVARQWGSDRSFWENRHALWPPWI
jgi:hypothetical protein